MGFCHQYLARRLHGEVVAVQVVEVILALLLALEVVGAAVMVARVQTMDHLGL
jgi:hypothetical protein